MSRPMIRTSGSSRGNEALISLRGRLSLLTLAAAKRVQSAARRGAMLKAGQVAAILVCFASTAADKSGVSPSAISLPKGPGSIEGLGESFQPNLNTGTAKYGIGLKPPPGVAGHAASLNLSYEGGGGNGPLGYGWSLPTAFV